MAPTNIARDFIVYEKPSDIPSNLKHVRSCVAKSRHRQRKQQRQQDRKRREESAGNTSTTTSSKPAASAANRTTQHDVSQSSNCGTGFVQLTASTNVAPTTDTRSGPWIDPCQTSFMDCYANADFRSWQDFDQFGTSVFNRADGIIGQSMDDFDIQYIDSRRPSLVADGAVKSSIHSELSQGLFSSAMSSREPNPGQSRASMDEMMARFPRKWADYIIQVLKYYHATKTPLRMLITCLRALSRCGLQDRNETYRVAEEASRRIALAIETDNEEPETIAALSVLIHLDFQLERREEAERNLGYLERVLIRNAQEWPSVPDFRTLLATTGLDFNVTGFGDDGTMASLEEDALQRLSCGFATPTWDDLRSWNGLCTTDTSFSQASYPLEAADFRTFC